MGGEEEESVNSGVVDLELKSNNMDNVTADSGRTNLQVDQIAQMDLTEKSDSNR